MAKNSLAAQTAARLAAAGITPDDPGIRKIREWNGLLEPGPCAWPTCPEHRPDPRVFIDRALEGRTT